MDWPMGQRVSYYEQYNPRKAQWEAVWVEQCDVFPDDIPTTPPVLKLLKFRRLPHKSRRADIDRHRRRHQQQSMGSSSTFTV